MTYEEAQRQIDDYVDRSLGAEERRAFEAFMASSRPLQEEVSDLQKLKRGAAELPRSMQPERDLWPGIQAQIEQPRRVIDFGWFRGRNPRYAVWRYAAAAAAIALLVFGVNALYNVGPEVGGPEPILPMVADDPELNAIAQQYMEAKQELLAAYRARQDRLPPDTLEVVERNLAIIEQSVNEINVALADHPDSPRLERMLHAAYQTEMDLLQQAVHLANES